MTWQPGRDKISVLVADGELEQVAVSDEVTRRLLQDAARHVVSATAAAAGGDLSGAYQLAYDAFRKSAASLLAVQGLRQCHLDKRVRGLGAGCAGCLRRRGGLRRVTAAGGPVRRRWGRRRSGRAEPGW